MTEPIQKSPLDIDVRPAFDVESTVVGLKHAWAYMAIFQVTKAQLDLIDRGGGKTEISLQPADMKGIVGPACLGCEKNYTPLLRDGICSAGVERG